MPGGQEGFGRYTFSMAARISPQLCERFQEAVDLVAKRWTPLVVQVLLEGPQRYSELRDKLDVVSERVLIVRLKELEAAGVVERTVIPGTPVRVEYALTDKGKALGRVVGGLSRWAEEWVVPGAPEFVRKAR